MRRVNPQVKSLEIVYPWCRVESETPTSRAMILRDQCVTLLGVVCVVLRTTSAAAAAEIVVLRPERSAAYLENGRCAESLSARNAQCSAIQT